MSEPADPIAQYIAAPDGTPAGGEFDAAIRARRAAIQAQRGGDKSAAPRVRWNADNSIMRGIYHAQDTISALPAPGGIALLVVLIVVLLIVLVPVTTDRETRLQLLFGVIGGTKAIAPPTSPTYAPGTPASPAPSAPASSGGTGSGVPMVAAPMVSDILMLQDAAWLGGLA